MGSSHLLKIRQESKIALPKIFDDITNVCFSSFLDKDYQTKEEIKKEFPLSYSDVFLEAKGSNGKHHPPLKVGVVLSGGQASGGHNVIIGIFDAIKKLNKDSSLIGFLNGPQGIFNHKYKELTEDHLHLYRNTGGFDLIGSGRDKIEKEEQLLSSLKIALDLNLDGIVIIGGDDSNTNAAILAEYFKSNKCHTKVVGVPKTIDGDLQNKYVDISFGFDTASKTYSELIGNIARDALSAKKYTHFIKLMGRTASHLALECALQVHPNLTFIGEEVALKKQSLKDLSKEITDLVIERYEKGKNFGIILLPEGLIEQMVDMNELIAALNHLLGTIDPGSFDQKQLIEHVTQHLNKSESETFKCLPPEIQKQLLLDRDPHGNVQVALIETEKLFIHLVQKNLREVSFKGKFSPIAHFFGYEGRAGFPTLFDATYCYSLGYAAAALIKEGMSSYMAAISGLSSNYESWKCYGIPLTSLMRFEIRKGKKKAVIEKALVNLKGKSFLTFSKLRESWREGDDYTFTGPIQFFSEIPDIQDVPKILNK